MFFDNRIRERRGDASHPVSARTMQLQQRQKQATINESEWRQYDPGQAGGRNECIARLSGKS